MHSPEDCSRGRVSGVRAADLTAGGQRACSQQGLWLPWPWEPQSSGYVLPGLRHREDAVVITGLLWVRWGNPEGEDVAPCCLQRRWDTPPPPTPGPEIGPRPPLASPPLVRGFLVVQCL